MNIIRSVLALVFVLMQSIVYAGDPARTILVEFRTTSPEEEHSLRSILGEKREDAVLSHVRDRMLVLATKGEVALMRERGLSVSVLMEDTSAIALCRRALFGPSMTLPKVYHTYERILDAADTLMRRYPERIARIPLGPTTQERRTMYAFRIADDVRLQEDRPALLFDACHHADEIMGAEICTALMRELVNGFGDNREVTDWLKRYTIYIIPVVNVDGHTVVTHGIDPRWRKNTRDTNRNGVLHEFPEGVDINRNYDFNWAHGGSPDSTSDRFRGVHPFSEAENRAIRRFIEAHKILLSISYHSQGEVIYYPWIWQGRKAPEDSLLSTIARGLAASIRTMKGDTTYRAEYGAGTVGQTYSWLYGKYGTCDFIVETGRGAHIFPEEEVGGIIRSNLEGVRYLLRRAAGPGIHASVKDARTGKPLEAAVRFPAIETEDIEWRTTDKEFGSCWRLLLPGTYQAVVTKDGYETAATTVTVAPSGWTQLDIGLQPAADTQSAGRAR